MLCQMLYSARHQHGVILCFALLNCILQVQPWVTTIHRRHASSSNKLTMYFDDVSRHSIGWKRGKLLKNMNGSAFHRTKQKHDAVKRNMLLGYDAESASALSEEEGAFLVSCALTTGLSTMLVSLVRQSYRNIDQCQSSNRCSSGQKSLA
jgi:hypothetical protein